LHHGRLRTLISGTLGVKGKGHGAISLAPTLAQRTRKDGAPPALVVQARSKASGTRLWPLAAAELRSAWTGEGARPHTWVLTLRSPD